MSSRFPLSATSPSPSPPLSVLISLPSNRRSAKKRPNERSENRRLSSSAFHPPNPHRTINIDDLSHLVNRRKCPSEVKKSIVALDATRLSFMLKPFQLRENNGTRRVIDAVGLQRRKKSVGEDLLLRRSLQEDARSDDDGRTRRQCLLQTMLCSQIRYSWSGIRCRCRSSRHGYRREIRKH